jgi:hypothetical protein
MELTNEKAQHSTLLQHNNQPLSNRDQPKEDRNHRGTYNNESKYTTSKSLFESCSCSYGADLLLHSLLEVNDNHLQPLWKKDARRAAFNKVKSQAANTHMSPSKVTMTPNKSQLLASTMKMTLLMLKESTLTIQQPS